MYFLVPTKFLFSTMFNIPVVDFNTFILCKVKFDIINYIEVFTMMSFDMTILTLLS